MTWQDRLREAAWISPSGQRFTFDYEDVETSVDARGTMHEFPGVSGGYGQRTGVGPRRFPLTCYFTGDDCDRKSEAFFKALSDDGVGSLEHPRYGVHDVVVLGGITLRDDLLSAANQSVVEVTFFVTTGAVYPSSEVDLKAQITLSLDAFNAAGAQKFKRSMRLKNAINAARAASSTVGMVASTRAALRKVASATRDSLSAMDAAANSITQGIDVLIGDPLALANLMLFMVQAPARSIARIKDRLASYADLARSIIGGFSAIGSGDGGSVEVDADEALNNFNESDLMVCGCVSSSALACASTTFETRAQALEAAEELLSQMDDAIAWRDSRSDELAEIDTGESYQALLDLVSLTAGYLVQISFSLLPERRVTLTRSRTVIDLCAELYGDVDGKLDYLIATNNLTGDEILEIPAGRTIVYYV